MSVDNGAGEAPPPASLPRASEQPYECECFWALRLARIICVMLTPPSHSDIRLAELFGEVI